MIQTISIIASGKVQGVYYRQSTKEKAASLGIKGEVKNLRDGKVQIIATGNKEQLALLVEWCKKGPEKAVVSNIEVAELPLKDFKDFAVVRLFL